jgi:hypothetical protein
MRAPSTCSRSPCRSHNSRTDCVYAGVRGTPPSAPWVFSSQTSLLSGWCRLAGSRTARSMSSSLSVPSGWMGRKYVWTPPSADAPPASLRTTWFDCPTIISSPRWQWVRVAVRLPIVPLATNSAASLPSRSAASASSALTVGSSPYTSSPTSARAIASRISGVGQLTVSLRRSMQSTGEGLSACWLDFYHYPPVSLTAPCPPLQAGTGRSVDR